ncbi:NAD-dependent epimerase/dehydratase family protein [Paratractidigestivibacter faecalis]|uniref:NAD-dependent epimerase/dehydratase family protein n=1 Tax=Paratractidigestivibacter faecalis TaxID=2292441 RepID=UPI003F9C2AC2
MRSELLDGLLAGMDESLYEPFRNKTIAVTGATGLIGSLVCKALLLADERMGLGCKVLAVIRDKAKLTSILGEYSNLGELAVVECDLAEGRPDVAAADFILHAAAVTKSRVMVECPADVALTSLRGTEAMLESALLMGARMVYISSMEVYGTLPEGEVADESALGWIDLSAPRSCYPESKRMCECLCAAYAAQYGVQVCSARLAQTFGAGVLPGESRAFAQFARAAMRDEEIVLRTRGLSEGNYVNTVDCVAGLFALLAHGKAGCSYNVVNEESHGAIRQVAELASRVLGRGVSKVVIDVDEANQAGYAPDVHLRLSSDRLRGLGWKPKTSLAESFAELGIYLREQDMV